MNAERPGWKQYAWRQQGDNGDYWQRDDGRAEVFSDPVYPGFRVNVWRLYKNGPHKQTKRTGRMALLAVDLISPNIAMELADEKLPLESLP
jgi:hypothetical protein